MKLHEWVAAFKAASASWNISSSFTRFPVDDWKDEFKFTELRMMEKKLCGPLDMKNLDYF